MRTYEYIHKIHVYEYCGRLRYIISYNNHACNSQTFVFPFWLPLEHGASTKLPVSLQFLNLGQSVGLLGRMISLLQKTSNYAGQYISRINYTYT
jgi:hypothetical protein